MPVTPETRSDNRSSREAAGTVVGCFLLLLVSLHLAASPFVKLSTWRAASDSNPAVAEAQAWHEGRLTLPTRFHDTALFQGRVHNVFPPLFTLISYVALGLGKALGTPPGELYSPWYVALVALPLPLAGFWAFRQAVGSAPWAAAFTFLWIVGTPVLPCLVSAQDAGISHVNHLLSQTGIMLIVCCLLSGKRHWPGWLGLIVASWTRPLTILFAIAFAWSTLSAPAQGRRKAIVGLCSTVFIALALPMGLSWAKFGSPFESGYRFLYEGRQDALAKSGQQAIFSPTYIPRNAWYLNCETPRWDVGAYGLRPDVDPYGASIWLTMPILLMLIAGVRQWWKVPRHRILILSTIPIVAGVLMFHGTGYIQPGYYRFALDFIPAWLVVIAAHCLHGVLRQRLTIAAMAWSVLYFNIVTGMYAT